MLGFRVPNSVCELKVDAWHGRMEPMWQLPRVWVRMEGIPERHTGDFLALWGLGTLFDKTAKVDMAYTRRHKVLRILIGCVDHTKIPKDLPLWIKDGFYQIRFIVEPMPIEDEGDMEVDDDHDHDDDPPSGHDDLAKEKEGEGKLPETSVTKSVSSTKNSSVSSKEQGTPSQTKKIVSGVVFSPMVLRSFERASRSYLDTISGGTEEAVVPRVSNVARVLQAERDLLRRRVDVSSCDKVSDHTVILNAKESVDLEGGGVFASPSLGKSSDHALLHDDSLSSVKEGSVTSNEKKNTVLENGSAPKVGREVAVPQDHPAVSPVLCLRGGAGSSENEEVLPAAAANQPFCLPSAAAISPISLPGAAEKTPISLPAVAGYMVPSFVAATLPASARQDDGSLPALAGTCAGCVPPETRDPERMCDVAKMEVDTTLAEPYQKVAIPENDGLVPTDREVIAYGGITSPSSRGIRSSARIRSQPMADVHSMERAMLMA